MTAARLMAAALAILTPGALGAAAATRKISSTCGSMKAGYKAKGCCGNPDKASGFQVAPVPDSKLFNSNICANKKPIDGPAAGDKYFNNVDCVTDGVLNALEQSGTDITVGYEGGFNAGGRVPILTDYMTAGLCPVNVHWHLGTEHRSAGEYDETGTGPAASAVADDTGADDSRRLSAQPASEWAVERMSHNDEGRRTAATARLGMRCKKYMANDAKFTTEYDWKHCVGMHVGETYEVHWPHSAAGACGTPYQYQTPFYDGVFCKDGIISLDPLNTYQKIGVQGQVFVIVNDESYYYPDLMRGAIVDGDFWKDVAKYTGSTTGTSRSNTVCSRYTPITWQVDRKCHLISASSFDKMCADMKTQSDDMNDDTHAHGSRELVATNMAANNLQRRMLSEDSKPQVLHVV